VTSLACDAMWHPAHRASPASVKGGAGCAAAEGSPLADAVTPKLVGCTRCQRLLSLLWSRFADLMNLPKSLSFFRFSARDIS